YQRAPVEAVLMLLFLLSLAGIPPAAGFLGKYYIFLSLIESGHYALASLGVLYSLFGLYYYLKIANSMLMRAPMEAGRLPVSLGMRCAVGVTALATIVIGVFPEPFIRGVNWSLNIAQSPHVAALIK
ncbi:MAG: proton-conducting transporter membrane subunit, partial [Terriglobales bacterium]